jgi:hypothetical protein
LLILVYYEGIGLDREGQRRSKHRGRQHQSVIGRSSVTRDNAGKELSLAHDLKAATSDAIKKTASLFGIGLELYGGASVQPEPTVPIRGGGT